MDQSVKPVGKHYGALRHHPTARQAVPFEEERRLMEQAVAREVVAKDGESCPQPGGSESC
ncbi:MAG: hypothetical protein HPY44_06370 [Armatimonadetes bacterium]|nr:hypothetical protein [Armatimonadota bacterium]